MIGMKEYQEFEQEYGHWPITSGHECEECQQDKPCKLLYDPFEEEVHGEQIPKYLCKPCHEWLKEQI
jgi:hypothetical protein